MVRRLRFIPGGQRQFLSDVLVGTASPSLRSLRQFGVIVPYSTLKNFYAEERTLPEDLFVELCALANLNPSSYTFEVLDESWGKVKGGKISRRS